ncbi:MULTISPECIES: hypothetical protein [Rahnella]|jgi:hypothetical protein|uniref:DUF1918 domain-containing protein n=1 Tax=Rahnella variigena TaxID=574964 RepID=A0ABX9PX64_9GAMM|nr:MULTISPECIES: hypothetical protein [Rahnella]MDH2896563.1 hypothetical protein [Rahnella variigena]RJT52594.1 hypothetical protein D6D38_13785 [Rahnella variigena]RKF69127.1 hypothetical protein CKQ54_12465 [Rahnella variigena]RYJ17770.1 hypothetical protein C5Y41_11225 [Rahnella variigena]TCQ93403.1 hypothetical protein EC840_101457 [Rahnella sp. JUb53]
MKFPKGSIVKHRSGDIKGRIMNTFESQTGTVSYFVSWEDGSSSLHKEDELHWANIDVAIRIKNFYEK